jgi:PAS domain-containing protein
MYVRLSSRRRKQLHSDLRSDVERMSVYRDIVDDAPDIIAIISPDVHSHVLYINDTVRRVLHLEPSGLLGSSFWDLVHTEDKALLFKALTSVIFFKSATKIEPVRCRIQTRQPDLFVAFQMTLA